MSSNYPAKASKLLLPSVSSQNAGAGTRVPVQPLPGHEARERQEHHTLKILFTLLIIIAAYSFGSFSLAPHLLPASFFRAQAMPASQTATSTVVGGGACTATPSDLHYLPPQADKSGSVQLPSAWSQAGFNQKDLAYAQACAASFIIAYQSFDFSQAKTFETSTVMLTTGGQLRFYGHPPAKQPDQHLDPFWRASIQKQHILQIAQTSLPELLDEQYINKRMQAWMVVHNQLTIHRDGEVFTREDMTTVLVVSIPTDTKNQSEWQVAIWQDGNHTFPAPNPL